MCSNQAIAKKATIKELAGDHNTAFNLYVTAVQDFLHLSKVLQDEKERVRCKQAASTALARAEKIKAFKNDVLKPIARDFFSEGAKISCTGDLGSTKHLTRSAEERVVLDAGSRCGTRIYHFWTEPNPEEFNNAQVFVYVFNFGLNSADVCQVIPIRQMHRPASSGGNCLPQKGNPGSFHRMYSLRRSSKAL